MLARSCQIVRREQEERERKKAAEAERKAGQQRAEAEVLRDKIVAFKKIYQALYDGQTSWFKSINFLYDKQNLSDNEFKTVIDDHI